MAGIVGGADLVVEVIVFQGQCRVQVEALHVQNAVNQALLMHGGDLTGDAAQSEAAMDILVDHLLPQKPGRGQRSAAAAHLHGEAVVQIAGGFNDIGGGFGDQQFLGVLGVAGGPGHNALGIADILGEHHIVHVVFRNGPRCIGVGHQIVGDDDHIVGVLGISAGIAQRAAGDAVIIVTAVSIGVAVGIAGGRSQKRHINM